MKRLWLALMGLIVSLLLPIQVFAADAYAAELNGKKVSALVGESVSVEVHVNHASKSSFSSAELVLTYDSAKLSYTSITGTSANASVDSRTVGKLIVEDCGKEKALGNAVYTVYFKALSTGSGEIGLKQAAFSDRKHAETENLVPAAISSKKQSVSVSIRSGSSVIYPTGGSGGTTGGKQDYTFTVEDYDHYDYVITATVDGKPVPVIDNGDGSYTVKDASAKPEFKVSRTGKQYKVKFFSESGVALPEDTYATYGEDFRFDVPSRDGYEITVTVTQEDGTEVPCSVRNGVALIDGKKITGNLRIGVEQTAKEPEPTPTANVKEPEPEVHRNSRPMLWIGIGTALVVFLFLFFLFRKKREENE